MGLVLDGYTSTISNKQIEQTASTVSLVSLTDKNDIIIKAGSVVYASSSYWWGHYSSSTDYDNSLFELVDISTNNPIKIKILQDITWAQLKTKTIKVARFSTSEHTYRYHKISFQNVSVGAPTDFMGFLDTCGSNADYSSTTYSYAGIKWENLRYIGNINYIYITGDTKVNGKLTITGRF